MNMTTIDIYVQNKTSLEKSMSNAIMSRIMMNEGHINTFLSSCVIV